MIHPHVLFALLFLVAGFLGIVFTQSSLDKIFNYKANLADMQEQFKSTFLLSTLPLLLPVLTVGELLAGLGNLAAIATHFFHRFHFLFPVSFGLTGLVLLMLLFGQRVSKNYAGAVSLTGYFLIVLVGLFACAHAPHLPMAH